MNLRKKKEEKKNDENKANQGNSHLRLEIYQNIQSLCSAVATGSFFLQYAKTPADLILHKGGVIICYILLFY